MFKILILHNYLNIFFYKFKLNQFTRLKINIMLLNICLRILKKAMSYFYFFHITIFMLITSFIVIHDHKEPAIYLDKILI